MVTVTNDEVMLRASIEVPEELLDHDEVLRGTAWLQAGLELRVGEQRATFTVDGTPSRRTAVGSVPIGPDTVDIIVADATLLTEHNELRWHIDAPHRATTAHGLDGVFDGRRKKSLRDQWVSERPREVALTVGPAPSTWPWPWLLGLGLGAVTLPVVWRARQRALASTPPSPR